MAVEVEVHLTHLLTVMGCLVDVVVVALGV
jgi:hypothetical protein